MSRGAKLAAALLATTLAASWWATHSPRPLPPRRAAIAQTLRAGADDRGFARAFAPHPFVFPADHGPHPRYRNEWWYYTGNLVSGGGRRFGFQLTFFRTALRAAPASRQSAWGADQVYLAHFAVTDPGVERFLAAERWQRAALGLAGAQAEPFRVWVGPWSATAIGPPGAATPSMRLQAAATVRGERLAIDLTLAPATPPVPEGNQGLSPKSADPGNASYYYSLPRLLTRGNLVLGSEIHRVGGLAWLDREWSTSALSAAEVGWDWFGLQLADGRALMLYRLRHADGSSDPASAGTLISARGVPRPLRRADFTLRPHGGWRSPASGGRYPASWRLAVPSAGLDLELRPLLAAQELDLSFRYWEGAVSIRGADHGKPLAGWGYVEMTGYADATAGD
jgi:predicted secreted hydrolase